MNEARSSLLMSAYWKIPLQALVLLVGIFTFLFYLFHQPPMLFNPVHDARVRASEQGPTYVALEREFRDAFEARRQTAEALARTQSEGDAEARRRTAEDLRRDEAAVRSIRGRAIDLVKRVTGDASYTDVNYIFPTFITTVLPIGLVGLWIVAIITAATDSIAAELNSLATATVIDFYRRHFRSNATDDEYLHVSKFATTFWGLFACWVAVYASSLGSLIEVVNRFGSFFYGSILGVFALAILTERSTGTGAFVGLVAGMAVVAGVAFGRPEISFLWHNVIGAGVVFVVGLVVSLSPSIGRTGRG